MCFFPTLAMAEYHTSALSRDIFNKHLTPKLRNTWPVANMNYSNGNQDNFASNSENQDSLFPSLFFLSFSPRFLPLLSFFLFSQHFFLILSFTSFLLLGTLPAFIPRELLLLNEVRTSRILLGMSSSACSCPGAAGPLWKSLGMVGPAVLELLWQ